MKMAQSHPRLPVRHSLASARRLCRHGRNWRRVLLTSFCQVAMRFEEGCDRTLFAPSELCVVISQLGSRRDSLFAFCGHAPLKLNDSVYFGFSPPPGFPADTPPPKMASERSIRCLSCFGTCSVAVGLRSFGAAAKTLPREMSFGKERPLKTGALVQVSTGLDQALLQICQRPVSNLVRQL